jgi:hypothetical protein
MYFVTRTRRGLGAAAIGLVSMLTLASASVFAAAGSGRIRGEIVQADGPMLSVKTRDGAMLKVKVADDVRVSALVKASLADINSDTFIGIAGMPQADGSIAAFSIHIFLPAQRGKVPARFGPWDAKPGSTMTNAYVESKVSAKNGKVLTVKYKGGEQKIVVSPQTVIAAVAKGDKKELKKGAHIIIFRSEKQADGSVLAKVMDGGRNVAPAM